ncbi:MAG: hypothetical protein JWM82_2127 [Myxococcales bacterium]|nr:hypothetical protein [Myxococcales bacterium]
MSWRSRAGALERVVLGAMLVAALGCSRRAREGAEPTGGVPTLAALGQEVGLTFPSSARLLGVHRERGIDDLVRFKVELGADDLPRFLASSPVPEEAFEPGEGGLLGPDEDFWDPGRANRLRTGQAMVKNNRALNIGIADGPTRRVVLYIVNHGT